MSAFTEYIVQSCIWEMFTLYEYLLTFSSKTQNKICWISTRSLIFVSKKEATVASRQSGRHSTPLATPPNSTDRERCFDLWWLLPWSAAWKVSCFDLHLYLIRVSQQHSRNGKVKSCDRIFQNNKKIQKCIRVDWNKQLKIELEPS